MEEEFTTLLTDVSEMAPASCASISEATMGASSTQVEAATLSLTAESYSIVIDNAAQEIKSDKVG